MRTNGIQEFTFEKAINLKMIQLLEQEGAAGIVLLATIKKEGRDAPVIMVHKNISNKEVFMSRFFHLLTHHGVTIQYE